MYGIAVLLSAAAAVFIYNRFRYNRVVADLAAARSLNWEKDEFLSSVSHQLRTPLSAVSGFLKEVLGSWDDLTEADRVEFLGIADRQADEMTWMIHNLLVASRSERGMALVKPAPTDLCELVSEVVGALPEPKDRTVRLVLGKVMAVADPFRTRQIIRNLCVNALEHGGSVIEVRCRTGPDTAVIEVCDNGPGISDGLAETVFERYIHPDNPFPLPSIGLGLPVSRILAELMGGHLSYHREQGLTVFSLHLPQASADTDTPIANTESGSQTS